MSILLETPRLIMREFCEEDAGHLFELNSDPDVTRYVGEGPYVSLDAARDFIRNYNQYEKYRQGRLNVFDKKTGEYIGWSGLKYIEDEGYTDIGYRLLKQHWGKGYATESAKASLDYGFKTLGLDKIVGRAMKQNIASIAVLKKLGMQYSHEQDCGCHPGVVYIITKDQWK